MVNWTSEAGRIDSCAQGAVGCLVHRFGIGLHSDHCLDLQSFTGDWGLGCFDVLFFCREKPSVFWGKIVWCMSKNFFFLMAGGKNLDVVSLTCKKHLESDAG